MTNTSKSKTNKRKKTPQKVSYYYRPDNLTLKQWQIALRQQAAQKEGFTHT